MVENKTGPIVIKDIVNMFSVNVIVIILDLKNKVAVEKFFFLYVTVLKKKKPMFCNIHNYGTDFVFG